jgi:hypothetical protein
MAAFSHIRAAPSVAQDTQAARAARAQRSLPHRQERPQKADWVFGFQKRSMYKKSKFSGITGIPVLRQETHKPLEVGSLTAGCAAKRAELLRQRNQALPIGLVCLPQS